MVTIRRRPTEEQVPRSTDEREEQPSLEGLRSLLRVVIALSLAATFFLAVIPVFGMLGLIAALPAALAYVGLMIITRVEHRRWLAAGHDGARPGREVGFRVVTGGERGQNVDTGDATTDQEAAAVRPAAGAPAVERGEVGREELLTAPQRAGARVALKLAVIVTALAVIFASFVFDLPQLGIGILVALALMALFGAPVWLASMEDAAEAKKQRPQPR